MSTKASANVLAENQRLQALVESLKVENVELQRTIKAAVQHVKLSVEHTDMLQEEIQQQATFIRMKMAYIRELEHRSFELQAPATDESRWGAN
jgi:hypothetical protein